MIFHRNMNMNKFKSFIIALTGLFVCSCGNKQIAFPENCLTFDTPSGKALKVARAASAACTTAHGNAGSLTH